MLRSHSAIFYVNQDPYVASGFAQPIVLAEHTEWSRVTVVSVADGQYVSAKYMKHVVEEYTSQDDVFQSAFLQGIIFTGSPMRDEDQQWIAPAALEYLRSCGNEWIELIDNTRQHDRPPPGVFVASQGSLYEVYRLYPDTNSAFMTALIKGPSSDHFCLGLLAQDPRIKFVAVPTRIRNESVDTGVLDGWRIAVKDNFHINGIRTSLCNYAYYSTYPPQTKTAACITKLLNTGARLVGTTKMAAFAATEEPIECVDYGAPWNPRADGYQSPAGSSSGSGAATASYEWLDIAIGTDTSGSGRRPAHWNGCFGLRPTHGLVNTEGLVPSFPQFDTPTLFGRSIYRCREFVKAWYGGDLTEPTMKMPVKIVVLTDYIRLIQNADQRELIDKFVADLEDSLQMHHERVTFEELWDASPPGEAAGQSFADYMEAASRNSFFYDDYHNTDQFRVEYMKMFRKAPYISPPVRWQWDLSASITEEQRNEAVHRLFVYQKWFNEKIMEEGIKKTIVVIPIENISPRYRDEARTSFNPVGVPMLFLSPILGGPECTVPIGQVPFVSKVSSREEYLPVGISLLSSPGMDLDLLQTITHCLEVSGRPTEVRAGSTMF